MSSNFLRSLELPLINTKLYMELNWTNFSVLCNQDQNSIFQVTKGELYLRVVTLNTGSNNKLSELLSKGFERTVVWNEYKSKIEIETVNVTANDKNFKRTTLDGSFQDVNKLFAAAYETGDNIRRNANTRGSRRRYYLSRAEIINYNILIDGRNFYDQNVNSSIVSNTELLKMTAGRSEDYSTGCLLDYDYYLKDFNIVGIDLSHQAVLDSNPKINQKIEFIYKLRLSNQPIKKLKEAVKGNNGTTLRIVNKNFNKADLLHELFLTQTQINKLKEKVENNMWWRCIIR